MKDLILTAPNLNSISLKHAKIFKCVNQLKDPLFGLYLSSCSFATSGQVFGLVHKHLETPRWQLTLNLLNCSLLET